MVGSIQAIPICCHMNLYSPTLTPNFDLPWPLRPLFDLLDIFFQLQNIQLNRFINGTSWYMAKTCANGFQNLGCYAAKTTFYFIEEPIVISSQTRIVHCSLKIILRFFIPCATLPDVIEHSSALIMFNNSLMFRSSTEKHS